MKELTNTHTGVTICVPDDYNVENYLVSGFAVKREPAGTQNTPKKPLKAPTSARKKKVDK